MLKKQIAIAAIAMLSFTGVAQKLDNSLLWKISGNGLKEASYLYGTVHITCDNTLDQRVLKALDNTQQLYLEIDMDQLNIQMEMAQAMMMKDGTTLRKILPKATQEQLDAILIERVGVGIDALNIMQPQAISIMLMPSLMECEAIKSVEEALMTVTKEQQEEIYGLETVETQIKAFQAMPINEQADLLVKTLNEGLDQMKVEFEEMMSYYTKQDIEGLYQYSVTHESFQGDEYAFKMLEERNRNWIPLIAQVVKEKPTFFGVGAAHLAGDIGVIKLLRQAGFKVEAVK